MIATMSVKCIDKKICEDCPDLDLEVKKMTMFGDLNELSTINSISCSNYTKCARLLRFLVENKDDMKYIGRDGD